MIVSTSLADAEPYGDFLTHPLGHYEVWTRWQKSRAAPMANRFVLKAIADNEYEIFPRGRMCTTSILVTLHLLMQTDAFNRNAR